MTESRNQGIMMGSQQACRGNESILSFGAQLAW